MAKYRKKPIVIEAEQFLNGKDVEGMQTTGGGENRISWCETLEGRLTVSDGDWIIKGVKGEFYPCRPDIFEQTYEKVT